MATREARRRGQAREVQPSELPVAPARPVAPVSSLEPPPNTWRRRSLRAARRLAAVGAFAAAAFLAYSFVAAPLLERAEEEAALEEAAPGGEAGAGVEDDLPPRPESVPQRIPQWAWDLNEWHSTPQGERGPRPEEAPARVPGWYWEWRGWRAETAARAGS